MNTAVRLGLFTVAITAFYNYVGHWVPQKEVHPPVDTAVSADMSADEMVAAGSEIVAGKGTCLGCHTIGSHSPGRFPDLAGVGARAAERGDSKTAEEYLAEALYEPDAFIVDGFSPGMTPANKPPIGLTDAEILTVIAYLQSLGGTPSATMSTKLSYQSEPSSAPPAGGGSGASADLSDAPRLSPEKMLTTYCGSCHDLAGSAPRVGPGLGDVGARLTPAELYEAILDPDRVIAEGFPGGIMSASLKASGFYDKASSNDIRKVVAQLVSATGHASGPASGGGTKK